MSHVHAHDLHPPRQFLLGIGALILFALMGVAVTRLAGLERQTDWQALSTQALALRFEDGAAGSVLARDPESGAVIMEWAPETGGFVRTSLRSLAITRKRMGIGPEPAFLLHRTGKGRFILEDPSTGEWVSLDAFGRDNAGEFAKLYKAAEARR
ncbi:MAG: photosynthetic complex assembly protein PuhC [Hyphomonas sp.]|jgi:putative photosynthetic complex assembly protein